MTGHATPLDELAPEERARRRATAPGREAGRAWMGVRAAEVLACAAVAASAAALYVLANRQPLFWDEYYHLLAARSWAADGVTAIADGSYTRAAWLSIATGLVFRLFGEHLLAAKILPCAILVLWTVALFVWVRHLAGRLAAWASAVMFVASPLVLMNGTMLRWYGLSGLLLLLVLASLHGLLFEAGSRSERGLLAGCLGGALLLSVLVTELAPVWFLGPAVLAAGTVGIRLGRSHGWIVVGAATLGIAVVGTLVLWKAGVLASLWESYRWTPLWSLERANDVQWYEAVVRGHYPALWSLLPVAAIVAYRRSATLTWLCLAAFLVPLAVLSGAGAKAERYVVPVLPGFFVLWGVALADLVPRLTAWARDAVARTWPGMRARWREALGVALAAASLLFVAATNPGFLQLREVVRGQTYSRDRPSSGWGTPPAEWDGLRETLGPHLTGVDVVVTANSLQTLYHLGDYDYAFRPTAVLETVGSEQFGLDPRTGRQVVSTLESLLAIVERHPSGLVFGETWRWSGGTPVEGFAADVEAYIEAHMVEVATPPASNVRAYVWGAP